MQKSDWDKSVFHTSKNLGRNEKVFLSCFFCEIPERKTAVDKLMVLRALSETLPYRETAVTLGSELKLTKLSEQGTLSENNTFLQ